MNAAIRSSGWRAAVAAAGLWLSGPAVVLADTVLAAQVDEPRAYGWRVGDLVHRVVHLQVPDGWQLDERSLPKPDQRGGELELRALKLVVDDRPHTAGDAGGGDLIAAAPLVVGGARTGDSAEHDELGAAPPGGVAAAAPELSATGWREVLAQGWSSMATASWRQLASLRRMVGAGSDAAAPTPALRQAAHQRLELDYQLFAATSTARKLELPTLTLVAEPAAGLTGTTPRELRLPARPLWLVSLAGAAPANQSGLGEMRPDVAVQGVATAAPARQLVASLLVAAALLLLAAGAGALLRWLGVSARAQPFTQASRDIRRLLARRSGGVAGLPADAVAQAWRLMHQAFDRSAGHTLLPRQARTWALSDARYAGLADEIERFFDASAERFFAVAAAGSSEADGRSTALPPGTPATAALSRRRAPVVAASAQDDHRFDSARLMRLAQALARAEAAGLASQGARRASIWWRRRARFPAADAGTGERAGAGAGAEHPGDRAHG